MPVRRDERGRWRYRKVVKLPDGQKVRIFGTPNVNTKAGAEEAERQEVERRMRDFYAPPRKEVPTFEEWFEGRFWEEWVLGRKNKQSEKDTKQSIYNVHLKPVFGALRLDEIGDAEAASFRAALVKREGNEKLGEKRINNILAVLSKPLRYAEDLGLITRAPRVGFFRVERPEIVPWSFAEYESILQAAQAEGPEWFVAVLLAGDAGLRAGEIRALNWDGVDLAGNTITVSQQSWRGTVGTPKGRTRRVVPMTPRFHEALRSMEVLRRGRVVRNLDGTPKLDHDMDHTIDRIYHRAEVPTVGWHRLRHTFGTDAARFGVTPWTLMMWMGHKRMEETFLYVNLSHAHERPIPENVLAAGAHEADPDRRALKMLGARGNVVATTGEGRAQQA